MVHIAFTWRYGGQRVDLYGSFNGWTDGIQMLKVEGSGTVFQRVLDLPPSCYQFRFLVDDVWQVDKEQQCVQGACGIIDNLIFVEKSEAGTSSDGLVQNPVLRPPSNEIDVLRHHLAMYLSSSTAYDMMPDSVKVVALGIDVSVREAFHFMHEEGVAVLPLWDEQSARISGMLTASDFILVLLHLHSNRTTLTDEDIDEHTISSWKDLKLQHHGEVVVAPQHNNRKSLIQAGPDESLRDVVVKILQNRISAVPVLNSRQHGSCPELLFTVCLSGILKYICRQMRRHLEFLPLLQQPVGYILLGTWAREFGQGNSRPLLSLCSSDPLSSALNLLMQAHVSSIPIVDDHGILIDVYCKSDITSLADRNVYAHIQLDRIKISQVLEVVNVTGQIRYQTCTRFDSLYRVMELLMEPGVRRVIVVDSTSRRVEGIITLSDIFGYILG